MLAKLLAQLQSCILHYRKVTVLVFFEQNVFASPAYEQIFKESDKLLQNILYFPLYSSEQSFVFLKKLAYSWGVKQDVALFKKLAHEFGGSLWLLREALRCVKDYKMTG